MKVAIVGGGIGGLTLALMLHQRGIDCDVYEGVRELKPLGVGINLLPHAVAQMDHLGMLDTLSGEAIHTSALHYYNVHGQTIWQEPRGLAAGYPVPQLSIHRGRLQLALAHAVAERMGRDRLHTGMMFEDFVQDAKGITARFKRRATDQVEEVRADLLIGADGIHSAVRQVLYPHSNELRFSGRMLWRAITVADPYLDGKTMFMAGHQDQKFVAYPISESQRKDGRSCINWIAELRISDAERPPMDWNRQVDASVFADRFAGWKWDWIDIPSIIRGAEAIYEFPLVDKDPLAAWTQGRVTLLGDAAHPMYPIGSNGSAQAILDARFLADLLAECRTEPHPTVEQALERYQEGRAPITADIVLRNRQNGPEQVMQIAHERAPDGYENIHDVVPEAELHEISAQYKKLAGFDPTTLKLH